jgi:hypothetical protein
LTYLDGKHSIPFYDGSVLNGETDIDRLTRPALSAETVESGVDVAAGGAGWLARSYLAQPMELRGLITEIASSEGDLVAEGGELYRVVPIPGTGRSLVYVTTRLGAGVPGKSASVAGRPFEREVGVSPAEATVPAAALTP